MCSNLWSSHPTPECYSSIAGVRHHAQLLLANFDGICADLLNGTDSAGLLCLLEIFFGLCVIELSWSSFLRWPSPLLTAPSFSHARILDSLRSTVSCPCWLSHWFSHHIDKSQHCMFNWRPPLLTNWTTHSDTSIVPLCSILTLLGFPTSPISF